MKRIVIFSLTYYPRFIGGAEVAVKEITERLAKGKGNSPYQFDLITARFDSELPDQEQIGGVTVYRVGFTRPNPSIDDLDRFPLVLNKYLFPFLAAWKAHRLHSFEQYAAAWSIMANYAGFAALFFKWLHRDTPFLLTLQEGDPFSHIERRTRFIAPLFRKIFTTADRIQAISRYLGNWAREMGATCPIDVIPNGVNAKQFATPRSAQDLVQLESDLGKQDGEIFLITVSRLVRKNGIEDIICALQYVPKTVRLLIVGIGPREEVLRALVERKGLADRVRFVGEVPHSELSRYLQASDIFARPSLSEGMGNAFIEAMAAGLPVVATQVGGIVDFLSDPDRNPGQKPTGRAVRPRDPEGIARAVRAYIDKPEQTLEIIENARAMVFEEYDWKIIAQKMRKQVFSRLYARGTPMGSGY